MPTHRSGTVYRKAVMKAQKVSSYQSKPEAIFTVPLYWDDDYLDRTFALDTAKCVTEFYGCLNTTPFRSGRILLDHQNIELDKACNLARRIHTSGRRLSYLLNVPFYSKGSVRDEVNFLRFIRDDLECDAIVVADFTIATLARNIVPELALHISTVANVDTPEALIPWYKFTPQRIILPHDLPHKTEKLCSMLDSLYSARIEPEMMVTESCLFECPWRKAHYIALGKGEDDQSFHLLCRRRRLEDPIEVITSGSFIRPQDLHHYLRLGICRFKISGRSKPKTWLLNTIAAYISSKYDGNLVDLMGMDPKDIPENWIELKSESLDGMLDGFFKTKSCDWVDYVRRFVKDREQIVNILL